MTIQSITNEVFKQFPQIQELEPKILEMIVEYILQLYDAPEGK